MVGHINYLSEKGMQEKFEENYEKADYEFSFDADFQVESYLRHQGFAFVERFDANSVLYITRADYFIFQKFGWTLQHSISKTEILSIFLQFAYWQENKDIVIALNASGADVSYSEIISDKGHDSSCSRNLNF